MDRVERLEREIVVPDVWTDFYQQTQIPAAVKVGHRLYVTGHTGTNEDGSLPEDAESQIRKTFENIALTLIEAGASWTDVVELTSYRVGLREQGDLILRVASEFLKPPYPAWTDVGISELYEPGAVIEIRCTAILPLSYPR